MNHVEDQRAELTLEQKRALVARLLREKGGPHGDRPALVHRWI
jgi:hypothetical protein